MHLTDGKTLGSTKDTRGLLEINDFEKLGIGIADPRDSW
jgi:hypothetical protein